MSNVRNITVSSVEFSTKKVLSSSATTFGELKEDFRKNEISFDNKKIVIAENRNTLEADSAILPEGDFTVLIFPTKSKAGYINLADFNTDGEAVQALAQEVQKDMNALNDKIDQLFGLLQGRPVVEVAAPQGGATLSEEELDQIEDIANEFGIDY